MESLALHESAHGHEHRPRLGQPERAARIGPTQRAELLQIDPVADDAHLVFSGTQPQRDTTQRLRHRNQMRGALQSERQARGQCGVLRMALLGTAQRDGDRHLQPATQQRGRVTVGVAEMGIDQIEAARTFELPQTRPRAQGHEEAVQTFQDSGNGQEAREPDVETRLRLAGRRPGSKARAPTPQQPLQREPGGRSDHTQRQPCPDAEHALANEQASGRLGMAREQAAEHNDMGLSRWRRLRIRPSGHVRTTLLPCGSPTRSRASADPRR